MTAYWLDSETKTTFIGCQVVVLSCNLMSACWFRSSPWSWWTQGGQRGFNARQEPCGDPPHTGTWLYLYILWPTSVFPISFPLWHSSHDPDLRFVSSYWTRIFNFHLFQAQSDGSVSFKVIPGTKDELEAGGTEVICIPPSEILAFGRRISVIQFAAPNNWNQMERGGFV